MREPSPHVAALLVSGGSSRRLGHDKTQLLIGGATLARRTASLLGRVAALALEVGPGVSGLDVTREDPPGAGPLAALAQGGLVLRQRGHDGAALVVACDLPFLSEELLRFLASYVAPGSVVPVVRGRAQPLCARWSARDLEDCATRVARGDRSLRHVTTLAEVTLLDEASWRHVATEREFMDIDTPEDLDRACLAVTIPNVANSEVFEERPETRSSRSGSRG